MSALRKVAVLLLVAGGLTSLGSSGTFATFSASVANGGTFETGTLVLSDRVNSGTACLSTGDTATNNVSTDTNANTACDAALSVTNRKPGDVATASVQVTNAGSLPASGLSVYASGACVDGDDAGAYHGTGSACATVQAYVQETNASGTATACRYGKGASAVINSTARTFPLAITASTRTFSLNVDNVAHANLSIATNAGYTPAGLAAAINAVISTWAVANVGEDNVIYISSKAIGSTSKVTITNGSSNNALPTLGFTTGTTNTGGVAACSFDGVHTLAHLTSTHTSTATGLSSGAMTAGQTDYFVLGTTLPLAAGNDLMGRVATFGYTFTAQQ